MQPRPIARRFRWHTKRERQGATQRSPLPSTSLRSSATLDALPCAWLPGSWQKPTPAQGAPAYASL